MSKLKSIVAKRKSYNLLIIVLFVMVVSFALYINY